MQITPINIGLSLASGVYTTLFALAGDAVSATVNVKAVLQDMTKNAAIRMAVVPNNYVAGNAFGVESAIIPQDTIIGATGSTAENKAGIVEAKGIVLQPGQKLIVYSNIGFTTANATGFQKTNFVTIPSAGPDVQAAIDAAVTSILGSQITSAVTTAVQPAVNQAISNSTTVTNSVNTAVSDAVATAAPQITAAALASVQNNTNKFTAGQFYAEVDKGSIATGSVGFNLANGNVQKLTVAGPVTIVLSGWPAAGVFGELMIELLHGGSSIVTMPSGIQWELASASGPYTFFSDYLTALGRNPATLKTGGTDFLYFWSTDGGTTIHGKVL